MAVKYLTGYKDISDVSLYDEEERWYKFTYDFSVQGGANADTFNVCVLPKCIISDAYLHVETAIEGSSSTVEVGIATNLLHTVDS